MSDRRSPLIRMHFAAGAIFMNFFDLFRLDLERPILSATDIAKVSTKKRIRRKIRHCDSRLNTLHSLLGTGKVADAALIARFFIVDATNLLFLVNDLREIEEPVQFEQAIQIFRDQKDARRLLNDKQVLYIINKKPLSLKGLRAACEHIEELYFEIRNRARAKIKTELSSPIDAYKKKLLLQSLVLTLITIAVISIVITISNVIQHSSYMSDLDRMPSLEKNFGFDSFMRNWLLLGNLPEKKSYESSFSTDYLAQNGGEQIIMPTEGKDYRSEEGVVSHWISHDSPKDFVDLRQIIGDKSRTAAYAFTTIFSPVDQEVILAIGSDDGIKVWLNGALVHQAQGTRAAIADQDKIAIRLHEGNNALLLKVVQDGGEWGFYCRLLRIQTSGSVRPE